VTESIDEAALRALDNSRIRQSPDANPNPTAYLGASGGQFYESEQGRTVIYTSYSGVDIVAEIILPNEKPITLGELQTISYSTHRENIPVRFLGHVNPSAFLKGPRTIAGSLIFTVFNYYAFYRIRQFQAAVAGGLYPLADMLPPFDVVITFANESGSLSKMKIYGVTIVDEGQTMSIDDLMTEQTFAYMARGIQPMTAFAISSPISELPAVP
jgi:hypothetical protein